MSADVLDLGTERARRGLPPPLLRLEPEPPPGLRRGDKVRIRWSSLSRDPRGDIGIVTGHRWIPTVGADGERTMVLSLRVQTPSFIACCKPADVEILT